MLGVWDPKKSKFESPYDRVENLHSGFDAEFYSNNAPVKKSA